MEKLSLEINIQAPNRRRDLCDHPVSVSALVRSQRATGIGRLMVNIVEGIELKPCRSHGT